MTVSFHGGHSGDYCDHAGGKLQDVIRQATARGFTHYGLSEHMPRARIEDFYPEEHQRHRTPEQLEQMFAMYIREARQLQHDYRERLHILVGMETEMTEDSFTQIELIRNRYSPDYLVGSLHHVQGIPFDYSLQEYEKLKQVLGGTEAVYGAYYDAQLQLMRKFHPGVIGHFDLIRLYEPDFSLSKKTWEKIKRNLAYGISYDALFEVNARAFKKKLNAPYPQAEILQKLLAMGGKITLGDDSHHPEEVGLNFDRLFHFLKAQDVSSIYALEKDDKGQLIQKIIPLSPIGISHKNLAKTLYNA